MEKYTDIKTFKDACQVEGLDAEKVIPVFEFFPEKDRKAMQAISKLVIIAKAVNRLANDGKEWIPDWNDSSERKYELWFGMDDDGSSGFRFDAYGLWSTRSHVGSRLCFISGGVARYVGETFLEVYKEFFK